jgi:hypothetical protein
MVWVAWSSGPIPAAYVQNDVRRERDQFRYVFAETIGIASGPAIIDPHVDTVRPAQGGERLLERRGAGHCFRIFLGENTEHANAPHAFRLLRPRHLRQRRRCAEKRDEFPPLHSITSSARASSPLRNAAA